MTRQEFEFVRDQDPGYVATYFQLAQLTGYGYGMKQKATARASLLPRKLATLIRRKNSKGPGRLADGIVECRCHPAATSTLFLRGTSLFYMIRITMKAILFVFLLLCVCLSLWRNCRLKHRWRERRTPHFRAKDVDAANKFWTAAASLPRSQQSSW
jgi:hypothetical protein